VVSLGSPFFIVTTTLPSQVEVSEADGLGRHGPSGRVWFTVSSRGPPPGPAFSHRTVRLNETLLGPGPVPNSADTVRPPPNGSPGFPMTATIFGGLTEIATTTPGASTVDVATNDPPRSPAV
jgi:hypothetical protein